MQKLMMTFTVLLAALHAAAAQPTDAIIGVIRWDAWVGEAPTFGDSTSENRVGLVVERTLSPPHWHYRLPFFAVELGANQVQVRGNTQEVVDQEILYAAEAGIDYWAFVYYYPGSGLEAARNLYLNSAYRDAINFCLIVDGWHLSLPETIPLFVDYFKMQSYQKVLEGRPLVYILGQDYLTRQSIDSLRASVATAGLPAPYLVYMGWTADEVKAAIASYGLDAGSSYAQDGYDGLPFVELARRAEQGWEAYRHSGIKVIPWVTTGWDPRPRIETPVPWGSYPQNQWAQTAAPGEIASHLQQAQRWNLNHPETAEVNAIIIYAWNEFDEGGWLCPTLYHGRDRLDAIKLVTAVAAREAGNFPKGFVLHQNYPNPFNPSTVISFQLPVNSHVTLKVFDVLGCEVTTLVEGEKKAGQHQIAFDAVYLPGGVYFVEFSAGSFRQIRKAVLLR